MTLPIPKISLPFSENGRKREEKYKKFKTQRLDAKVCNKNNMLSRSFEWNLNTLEKARICVTYAHNTSKNYSAYGCRLGTKCTATRIIKNFLRLREQEYMNFSSYGGR